MPKNTCYKLISKYVSRTELEIICYDKDWNNLGEAIISRSAMYESIGDWVTQKMIDHNTRKV